MGKKYFQKGLDKRMRDHNGEIRKKRGDTKVKTLRKAYGINFAKGYPPDEILENVLKSCSARGRYL